MPRKRTEGLTDREAEIMAVLWQMGPSQRRGHPPATRRPPRRQHRALLARHLAERGLVAHDNTVYAKKYRPKLDQSQAQDSALRRVIDRLFSGSTEELLVRLIDEGAVDSAQLERLQKRLRERRDQSE